MKLGGFADKTKRIIIHFNIGEENLAVNTKDHAKCPSLRDGCILRGNT